MFGALAKDTAETSARIGRLQARIGQLRASVPAVEATCAASQDFSSNQRVQFKASRAETSQLFQSGTAMQPIMTRHNANPPLPDLAPLDRFRADGKACIMFYTYPQFFLDEWVREQEKEMADRKARNAERRAERAAKQQRNAPTTSVKQVMKRVYDVDTGQLITVSATEPSAMGNIERKAPAANQAQSTKSTTYVAPSYAGAPPPAAHTGGMPGPQTSTSPRHAPFSAPPPPSSGVAASFPPPPPISSMGRVPAPAPRVSPRPGGTAPAGQFAAPPPPHGMGTPSVHGSTGMGMGYAPPPAPAAPMAPMAPPPPAAPAAPPPPVEGSLAAQLEAVKAQTTPSGGGGGGGSSLLDQIAAGVRLKKAAPPRKFS